MFKVRHVLPVLMFLLASCFHSSGTTSYQPKTIVQVSNRGFNAVKVYLVHGSMAQKRIGFVEGNQSSQFIVSRHEFENQARICLVEFASRNEWCSEIVMVSDRAYVEVVVGSRLEMSYFFTAVPRETEK